jgi:hypothetical protein
MIPGIAIKYEQRKRSMVLKLNEDSSLNPAL